MDRRATRAGRVRGAAATAVVVLVGLPACAASGGSAGEDGAGAPDLEGRSFVSTGSTGRDLVEGSEVHMVFGTDRVSVRAGCNVLNGAATWDDGVLTVEQPMATTLMACDDALTEQDDWLTVFLGSAPAVTFDPPTLTIGDESENLVLDEQ